MLEDPEIARIERTGYPSWFQDKEPAEFDEDAAYDEQKERELFGE